jgi:hypothetical protein
MICQPVRRRLVVQLSLQLSESPAPADVTWEALTSEERLAVVAGLARVMAKSVKEKEEGDE